ERPAARRRGVNREEKGGDAMPFVDRMDAGRRLSGALDHLRGDDVVVLGLARGGVVVASEVAEALGAPLDVVLVRKLGVQAQPELAAGAAGEGGVLVRNESVVRRARVSETVLADLARRARAEIDRRALLYRGGRAREPVAGRTAVVVDDGIATGATARAARPVVPAGGPARPCRTPDPVAEARGVVRGPSAGGGTRWRERAFLAVTVGAFAAGGVAWALGRQAVADACWVVGTVSAVVPSLAWVVAALRRGRAGVDLLAVIALVGTVAVGEYLAGA